MDDPDLRTTVADDCTLEVPASLREEIGLEPGTRFGGTSRTADGCSST